MFLSGNQYMLLAKHFSLKNIFRVICIDKNQLIMPQKCNRFCQKIWFFSNQPRKQTWPDGEKSMPFSDSAVQKFSTAIWYQVFLLNTNNLPTVIWYQIFLSNTNNFHVAIWYQVFLINTISKQLYEFLVNTNNFPTILWYLVFLVITNNFHTAIWYQIFLSKP